ncbi:MocE family 2Fe-2S type ferredoxin [Kineosporia sp. A_224]|uniref:MocE family 2Fe-2S type ferredoxin n=1 Tax=Kineosporia sp. A_224 TaxID=1962180 RepID=UPI000B4B54DF|nr:MocE family 2Fe-2S type ferredoxin [Kineosporia sp. A_224]
MPSWIPTVKADDVEAEDVAPFTHGGTEYAIYRSPDDEYFASDGFCTHEAEMLCRGFVMGHEIECPRHNGRFDYRTGKALGAPVLVGLRTYPTRVVDGVVEIDLD